MAQRKDLTIKKGRNYKCTFTFFEDESKLKPLPLTGMNFISQCRAGDNWTDPLLFDFSCAVVDSANGKMSISVSYSNTKELTQTKGFYDITETTTAKTLAEGEITFTSSLSEIL